MDDLNFSLSLSLSLSLDGSDCLRPVCLEEDINGGGVAGMAQSPRTTYELALWKRHSARKQIIKKYKMYMAGP